MKIKIYDIHINDNIDTVMIMEQVNNCTNRENK